MRIENELTSVRNLKNILISTLRLRLTPSPALQRYLELEQAMDAYLDESRGANRVAEKEKHLSQIHGQIDGIEQSGNKKTTPRYTKDHVDALESALNNLLDTAECGDLETHTPAELALRDVLMDFDEDPQNRLLGKWERDHIDIIRDTARDLCSSLAQNGEVKETTQGPDDTMTMGGL